MDCNKPGLKTLLIFLLFVLPASSYDARDYAVELSVSASSSPPSIKLQWPAVRQAKQYTVRRKRPADNAWSAPLAVLPGNSIQFVDSNVNPGSAFEYEVELETTLPSPNPAPVVKAYGYIYAGVEAPLNDLKGKVILVVDGSVAGAIAAELDQFENDLIGSGWQPIRRVVSRSESVINVRNLIRNEFNADPANVRSVVLIGHVPVPYSGLINPDFHVGHLGAWPADVFYGEMDGNWTDNSVWKTDSEDEANNNIPGDGKFDQSQIPSTVELEIGRIDFFNLPAFAPRSEVDLLRNYFRKNHNFRHRQFTLKRQGLVRDNFGDVDGDAPAVDAWRHFPGFFGFAATHEVGPGSFFPALNNDSFLWSYGGGGGGYTKADGVGTTDDFAASDPKSAFLILHGSYFGDWNNWNNFLRAAIATPNYTLASIWSGLPHWYMHHMALGGTIGFSTRLTQNNQNNLYKSHQNFAAGQVHISLIGDPTLEMFPMAPVSNVSAAVGTGLMLSWDPSPDEVAGYHVYHSQNPKGPFQRLTTGLAPTPGFTQRSLASGVHYFMVRPVKLERTGSGTFYNAGQGTTLRVEKDGSTPQLPSVQISLEDDDAREEGLNPGTFRITRSIVTSVPLVVDLQVGGTAQNGVDYDAINSSATIPAGVGTTFLTVKPKADELSEGAETVTLTIKSSSTYLPGSPSSATLTIIDQVVNQPPTISAISDVTIDEDTNTGPISFTVTDSGTAVSALTVQASSSNPQLIPPTGLLLDGTGESRTIRITPVGNAFGESTISLTASDGTLSTTRTFVVRVNPLNDPPTAADQTVTVLEDTPVTITFEAQDVDSEEITFKLASNPTSGIISGTPPVVTYTPLGNETGTDSFTFKANDGSAESAAATVQIIIQPVNDVPRAIAQSVAFTEDMPQEIMLEGVDVETTELTFAIVTPPTKGSLDGIPPALTYIPNPDYTGSDFFSFIVSDGITNSTPAAVQILIEPENDPPAIQNIPDQFIRKNSVLGPLTVSLTDIDTPADQLVLKCSSSDIQLLTETNIVMGGTGETRTLSITPGPNATGTTLITVEVSDGAATAEAQFTLTITNSSPIAVGDEFMVTQSTAELSLASLLANDSDPDQEELMLSDFTATSARGGIVTLQDENLVYIAPAGLIEDDSFTYTISDSSEATATATVFLRFQLVARIESVSIRNEDVVLKLAGPPSSNFVVSASNDGNSFHDIGNGKANSSGGAEFIDRKGAKFEVRIYRVKWVP